MIPDDGATTDELVVVAPKEEEDEAQEAQEAQAQAQQQQQQQHQRLIVSKATAGMGYEVLELPSYNNNNNNNNNNSSSEGIDVGDEGKRCSPARAGARMGPSSKKKGGGEGEGEGEGGEEGGGSQKQGTAAAAETEANVPLAAAAAAESEASEAEASACNPQEAYPPSTPSRGGKGSGAAGGGGGKKKGSSSFRFSKRKLAGRINRALHRSSPNRNAAAAVVVPPSKSSSSNDNNSNNANAVSSEAEAPASSRGASKGGGGGKQSVMTARKEEEEESAGPLIEDAFSDLKDEYDVDSKELGSGQYGIVRQCTNRETGEAYAVKTVKKRGVNQIDALRQEVRLLREVSSHPNIIKLIDVFEDKDDVHLVTELATGGELFDRIIAKKQSPEKRFTEREAACIIKQILDAVVHLHDEKDIVHRDIKPENFLFANDSPDAPIKIIDFGYAVRHSPKDKPLKDDVGTPLYMAPEVFAKKYTRKCDAWSVGIIAYALVAGFPPFNGRTERDIEDSVRTMPFRFVGSKWARTSTECKDFAYKLLGKKDPKKRMGAREARDHPWIRKFGSSCSSNITMPPVGVVKKAAGGDKSSVVVSSWGGNIRRGHVTRGGARRVSAASFAY